MPQNDALLDSLKRLWNIQDKLQDAEALSLINKHVQMELELQEEQLNIQQKVLAKTRAKTEALLKQVKEMQGKLS